MYRVVVGKSSRKLSEEDVLREELGEFFTIHKATKVAEEYIEKHFWLSPKTKLTIGYKDIMLFATEYGYDGLAISVIKNKKIKL